MIGWSARRRLRPWATAGAIAALVAAAVLVAAPSSFAAASLPAWTGGVNLYREGVFTTQASWLYCTAADVQIIRNMVEGTDDHSAKAQTAYFDWMRARNQYDLPLSAGVDPVGWAAGMRHFVDDRYELVASATFDEGLRLAVERIRRTNLPVALTVSHGNHGWVLHGFTATADPAATTDFEITSVRVTGPLWGLQSKNGYDMRPDTELTPDELRTFFTPWRYDPLPMIWDGAFVSIQPVPNNEAAAVSPPTPPTPPPGPTPGPTTTPTQSATQAAAAPVDSASPKPMLAAPTPPGIGADAAGGDTGAPPSAVVMASIAALAIALALGAGAVRAGRRR